MLAQLSAGTNYQRFSVYAITVAVFGILLAPGASAQYDFLIKISPTGSGPKPQLTVTASGGPSGGTCTHPATPDPRNLYVCPRDTVQWTSDAARYQIYIYHEDLILEKGISPVPVQSFDISDTGAKKDGGRIKSDSTLAGSSHEYYIAVFDKNAKRLYVEDPKVIIGTGTFQDDEVKAIKAKCAELEGMVTQDKEKAKAICKDIEKRLNQLLSPK